MRLCEYTKIVPIIDPEDHQSAGITGESVCLKDYGHCAFILLFGELTGNSVLKVREGAIDGATTADLTFTYRATAADILNAAADTLGTEATSAALTLTAATYQDRMIVVEVDNQELTAGYDWLTVNIDATASELLVSCVAVLSQPRFAEDVPPTAV